jgi:hypothetical protein
MLLPSMAHCKLLEWWPLSACHWFMPLSLLDAHHDCKNCTCWAADPNIVFLVCQLWGGWVSSDAYTERWDGQRIIWTQVACTQR